MYSLIFVHCLCLCVWPHALIVVIPEIVSNFTLNVHVTSRPPNERTLFLVKLHWTEFSAYVFRCPATYRRTEMFAFGFRRVRFGYIRIITNAAELFGAHSGSVYRDVMRRACHHPTVKIKTKTCKRKFFFV